MVADPRPALLRGCGGAGRAAAAAQLCPAAAAAASPRSTFKKSVIVRVACFLQRDKNTIGGVGSQNFLRNLVTSNRR